MKHSKLSLVFSKKTSKSILGGESLSFNLHHGLLPLALDQLGGKFIIICEEPMVEDVCGDLSLYIEEKGVYYGPDIYNSKKRFLGGYSKERESLFKSSLGSSFKNKKFILTTASGLTSKTIPIQKTNKELLINKTTTHSCLVSFLNHLGYKKRDVVGVPGDFSIRGFVVDFFPIESVYPVRVLFEDFTSIFYFDSKTQLTTRRVDSFALIDSSSSKNHISLKDFVSKDFLCVFVKEKSVVFNSLDAPLQIDLDLKYVEPAGCLSFNSKFVFESKTYGGFSRKGNHYVPLWLDRDSRDTVKPTGDIYIDFSSLEKGDFLIHEDFGVGKYLGLSDEEGEEFLILKYADAQIKVYPSLFNKISLFKKEGSSCSLDFVGKGSSWKRRVSSTKKSLSLFVESLFESYLERGSVVARPFDLDPELERLFLKGFPYVDTLDQRRSWKEIKKDMCSSSPMERLLCGDVGFGKTEIAMRAAFLCSINGGGSLVVAPTTILAKQLFVSFFERLKEFGIKVGFLSRFVSSSDAKETVALFMDKKIDVLVGTHRVINNMGCLNRADLLVVDDEHKFGVKQKSFVRSIKTDINVLYMSATPIPRTLNMALSKFSNISLISTPPPLKIAPKTYVYKYDFDLIKKALIFEYSRKGQSFIIHNNIKTMPGMVSKIKKGVPFLKVDYVHAQEDPYLVEKKMDLFINKKVDVLVASTILENGINIKNVNTVIINNSHLFGVSQLYQIRGRVGRGNVQSFAYLMYPNKSVITQSAKRRLNIIKKNSSLGSCYSVSMEDMKSRGSGSMFGYKQSGGVSSVGLELYGKLLNEAASKNPIINTSVSSFLLAFVPDKYLPSAKLRVWCYKEVSLLKKEEDVFLFKNRLINMFGPTPQPLENLLFLKHISLLGSRCGFSKISHSRRGVSLFLYKHVWENKAVLMADILKNYSFSFLSGGEGVLINKPLDHNFILILKEICARLESEK